MVQITEETFGNLLGALTKSPEIDLSDVSFIDPYGMLALLEIGDLMKEQGLRKKCALPRSGEVLKYLERMDFFKFAAKCFLIDHEGPAIETKFLRSQDTDVLLEITPISKSDDIHYIVGTVKERAHTILDRHLHYDERGINGFIVALSEVCQNIIEHSDNKGYVGIQKYYWRNIDKNIVKIAVMDIGKGFKKTLSERFPVRSDYDAIERGLLHGASRYAEKGRGHGLTAVRRFLSEWRGKLSIRSGTARLSIIPHWSKGKRKEENLAFFPGAQISIVLPEMYKTVFKK